MCAPSVVLDAPDRLEVTWPKAHLCEPARVVSPRGTPRHQDERSMTDLAVRQGAARAPQVRPPGGRAPALVMLGLTLSVLLGCQGLGLFKRPVAAASPQGQVAAPDEAPQAPSRVSGSSPALVQDAPATVDELVDPSQDAPLLYRDPVWFLFDNKLYSLFAHTFGMKIFGKTRAFGAITLTNNVGTRPQRLRLTLTMAPYAYELVREVVVGPGESQAVTMTPTFDLDRLYGLRAPTPAQLKLTIESNLNPKPLIIDRPLIIEPPTRVRWQLPSLFNEGERTDMRYLNIMLVTPDDRSGEVQKLVREAAKYTKYGQFIGYTNRATGQDIHDQVEAIYKALKARGFVYNNIAATYFDTTQRVRMPSESLKQNQGNCLDSTLVFASALEAVGLEPSLIFIRGHVFLGVSASPDSKELVVVETTVIRHMSYDDATALADKTWAQVRQNDPYFLMVSVKKGRQQGLYPINL